MTRYRLRQGVVVGLDLSLTGAAACRLPEHWSGDIESTTTMRAGYPLTMTRTDAEVVYRLEDIVDDIVLFCRDADAVYIEQYAFSQMLSRAHALGELGGAVKVALLKAHGIVAHPIVAASARKFMLQRLPRADVKSYVYRNVQRLGGPTADWTDDEVDAFCVANMGAMLEGGTALTFEGR